MSRLVDDLLLLARTDRGAAPQLEPVDTDDLVSTAIEGAQAAFPQRRIEVAVDPEVPLYGDYDQLLRVVRNLVTNAAVHTAAAGPIRVSAYRDGADSVLRVDDAGPGCRRTKRRRYSNDSGGPTRPGRGPAVAADSGMSIVRSIVEAHGGSVRFDSSVRSGSTVTVRGCRRPLPRPGAAPRSLEPPRALSVRKPAPDDRAQSRHARSRSFRSSAHHRVASEARCGRPRRCRRAAARQWRGSHGRLDGRRGPAPHAHHRAGHLLVSLPSGVLGERSDVGKHPAGQLGSPRLLTVTPCWSASTRSARRATPETEPASISAPCRSPSWTRSGRHRRRRERTDRPPRASRLSPYPSARAAHPHRCSPTPKRR